MTYIIIGAGSRGTIYGTWAHKNGHTVIAIAELRPDRLEALGDALEVPEDMRFASGEELLSLGQIADAAIIATQDRDHYGHVMAALDAGYDVLLEKPISPSPRECMEIEAKAKEANPAYFDVLPLSLEEIFIYELGGVDYEVNNIVL